MTFTQLPMTNENPFNRYEGLHTRGALWLDGNNEVWKPLHVAPSPDVTDFDAFVPSNEATFQAFANDARIDGFACDYHIETTPPELSMYPSAWRWIVRPRGFRATANQLSTERLLKMEQAWRTVNRLGWRVNDRPNLLYFRPRFDLRHLDGSAATQGDLNDDTDRVHRHTLIGTYWAAIRDLDGAIYQSHPNEAHEIIQAYPVGYVSVYRPLSLMWMDRRDEYGDFDGFIEHGEPPMVDRQAHWILRTNRPLAPEYLARYQLTWAFAPITLDLKGNHQ
jgi:hypothetical protein